MSPRLQRLATDWKTYAGLITAAGAGVAAATDLVNAVASAVGEAVQLPPEAKWLAAGLLAVLSVLALVSALSRRSTLLRPERFVISADDQQHRVGRDDEIERLATTCEQNSLVFLQGESGARKERIGAGGIAPALSGHPGRKRSSAPPAHPRRRLAPRLGQGPAHRTGPGTETCPPRNRCGSAVPRRSDPATHSPGSRPCRAMRLARCPVWNFSKPGPRSIIPPIRHDPSPC